MDVATQAKEARWSLAGASKYRDRAGAGCFGSVLDVVSLHRFGWDRMQCCLYTEDDYGIGGTSIHRIGMPVELAEQFLMSCLYPDFRQDFLIDNYGIKEPIEETLRAMGYTLKISRGVAMSRGNSGRYWLPGLSMACTDLEGSTTSLALFSDLRCRFGVSMAALSAPDIRKGLGSD